MMDDHLRRRRRPNALAKPKPTDEGGASRLVTTKLTPALSVACFILATGNWSTSRSGVEAECLCGEG